MITDIATNKYGEQVTHHGPVCSACNQRVGGEYFATPVGHEIICKHCDTRHPAARHYDKSVSVTENTIPKRIKRITSHVGLSRYLSYVTNTDQEIPRIKEIPSPYVYSNVHIVYLDEQGRKVFVVETAHKQYDVFLAPLDALQPVPKE